MKLTAKALEMIRRPDIRNLLAISLKCTDQTIMRYIKDNDDSLTKAAALAVIKKETGLSEEDVLVADEPARA